MRHPQDLHVLIVVTEQRSAATSDPESRGGLRWALPMGAAILAADQVTKRWALGRLTAGSCEQPDACIDLVAGARFHLVFNKGAAFAQGTGFGPVLAVLAAAITCVLLFLAWGRTDKAGSLLLGAITGGAVGNLVDRITRADEGPLTGAVVDFVDLGWWPVFNVADAAIVCGVLGFVVVSWFDERREMSAAQESGRDLDDSDPGFDESPSP